MQWLRGKLKGPLSFRWRKGGYALTQQVCSRAFQPVYESEGLSMPPRVEHRNDVGIKQVHGSCKVRPKPSVLPRPVGDSLLHEAEARVLREQRAEGGRCAAARTPLVL